MGCKPQWCLAIGGQPVCPRGPGDVATDPASGLWAQPPGPLAPPQYTSHLYTVAVQQPVDILRSVSAPLFQRYLDLSGSDI